MSEARWKEVKKSNPCPACGKADWCAWTPGGEMLKCERTATPPPGMVLMKAVDGGALFKYPPHAFAKASAGLREGGAASAMRPTTPKPPASRPAHKLPTYPTIEALTATIARQVHGEYVADWTYHKADGSEAFRVLRFALTDGNKTFRPVHCNSAGWIASDPPGLLPLYGLPSLNGEGRIWVVEGEKCADAARSIGLTATTSAHGAKSASKTDWSPLAGREVVILPDHDAAGETYAAMVAGILARLTPPATVKVVRLPGLPDGGDIVDWLDARDSTEPADLARALVDMAEAASCWTPAPAPKSMPNAKPVEPYRPFPTDSLPEPLRSFVAQAAEAVGCDAAFVALPLLAASASAIGNTRRIELKRGWTEPAILWASIVGDSGTLKSPALELALRPLRRRQHEAMKRHAQELEAHNADMLRYEIDLAAWKRSKGKGEPPEKPKEPVPWRCLCDDTTIEALAVLLQQNWRGLLMARDELAGWLGAFDRYAQGKGGDVAKWLEMHGGRSIVVDRKTGDRKTIYIPRAAVSITGAIQPVTLQRALGRTYFENGLAARLLLACPPRRAKHWTEKEVDRAVEEAVATMFNRL